MRDLKNKVSCLLKEFYKGGDIDLRFCNEAQSFLCNSLQEVKVRVKVRNQPQGRFILITIIHANGAREQSAVSWDSLQAVSDNDKDAKTKPKRKTRSRKCSNSDIVLSKDTQDNEK